MRDILWVVLLPVGMMACGFAFAIFGDAIADFLLSYQSDDVRFRKGMVQGHCHHRRPQEFGTEEEVLAMLKEAAVPGLVSVDEALGSVDWVHGWKYTLFEGADAEIKTWRTWLSDDGSVGGSLWTWSGTAQNGKPFEIPGVEITHYDENGLCADVLMFYPYSDEEVQRYFREGN